MYFLRLVGEALTVGRLVVQDGDLLAGEILGEIVARDLALLVVTAANAVDVGAGALVGELRVGRGWRNLDDAFFRIDLRRRDRRARAEVTCNKRNTGGCDLVCSGNRLLRVTGIVSDDQLELLADSRRRPH